MNKNMTNIFIDTIPQEQHRYQTVGDWFKEKDVLRIRVTKFGNSDYEFLIALHELVESYLCMKEGITGETVDKFDMEFKGEGEPGDDPKAPYYKQHQAASAIERLMAVILEADWKTYDKTIDKIFSQEA